MAASSRLSGPIPRRSPAGGNCRAARSSPARPRSRRWSRECREELGVTVTISDRIGPDVATVDGAGILRTWRAEIVDGLEPEPTEHRSLLWLSAGRLDDVDWLDADRPVLDHLRRLLHE